MAFIEVENIKKTYRVMRRQSGLKNALKSLFHREYTTINALNGISFTMDRGELVGYIGPNGAGKSTTVKILSGILQPDSGRCIIMDRIPWKQRIEHVKRIGVVFGQRSQLWWDVPVIDSFELLKDIYKVPEREYKITKDELVESLNLENLLETPVRQLSLGQRMRCEIAASLLHRPDILFLDEPTIGLDAISKLAVRNFILNLNHEKRTTIILTTHDMDDIEALCSRVMVIGRGSILLDDTLDNLRHRFTKDKKLSVEFSHPINSLFIDNVSVKSVDNMHAEISFNPGKINVSDLISDISSQYEIRDLTVEELPIDEIIAGMYREMKL